jgi:hypothetical protein
MQTLDNGDGINGINTLTVSTLDILFSDTLKFSNIYLFKMNKFCRNSFFKTFIYKEEDV